MRKVVKKVVGFEEDIARESEWWVICQSRWFNYVRWLIYQLFFLKAMRTDGTMVDSKFESCCILCAGSDTCRFPSALGSRAVSLSMDFGVGESSQTTNATRACVPGLHPYCCYIQKTTLLEALGVIDGSPTQPYQNN